MIYKSIIKKYHYSAPLYIVKTTKHLCNLYLLLSLIKCLCFLIGKMRNKDDYYHKIFIAIIKKTLLFNENIESYNQDTPVNFFFIFSFIVFNIIFGLVESYLLHLINCSILIDIQKKYPNFNYITHRNYYMQQLINKHLFIIMTDFSKVMDVIVLYTSVIAFCSLYYNQYSLFLLLLVGMNLLRQLHNINKISYTNTIGNNSFYKLYPFNQMFINLFFLYMRSDISFVLFIFSQMYSKLIINSVNYSVFLESILASKDRKPLMDSSIDTITLRNFSNFKNILHNNLNIQYRINYVPNHTFKRGVHFIKGEDSSLILKSICQINHNKNVYVNNKEIYQHNTSDLMMYISSDFTLLEYGTVLDNMRMFFPIKNSLIVEYCKQCDINPYQVINPFFSFHKSLQHKYINLIGYIFLKIKKEGAVLILDGIDLYDFLAKSTNDHIILYNKK